MRVARQHPLHLQVTRTNNGKFLVNQNSRSNQHDVVVRQDQQQQQRQQLQQLQQQQYHHHHQFHQQLHHQSQQQQQQQQQNQNQLLNNQQLQELQQQQEQQQRYNNNQLQNRQQQYREDNDEQRQSELLNQQINTSITTAGTTTTTSTNEDETTNASTASFNTDTSESNCPIANSHHGPTLLGDRFLLVGPAEGSALYRCVDVKTGQQLVAKALTVGDKGGQALLEAHLRLDGTGAASGVAGVVDAPAGRRYLLLEGHHGDLHAYVRARRRLREPEARRLFKQAAKAVTTCHENGVVLRDLKLRKFVFANEARTKLRLESLEDAVIVEDDDDKLADRRGCPAYVAPEVLRSGRAYSGKAADIWSLGVLLYTMLVGRYPFNDAEHASLFAKISRGQFTVPDGLSPRARCLVKALLRKEPAERPDGQDVVRHPWLSKPLNFPQTSARSHDQIVPLSATNYSQD